MQNSQALDQGSGCCVVRFLSRPVVCLSPGGALGGAATPSKTKVGRAKPFKINALKRFVPRVPLFPPQNSYIGSRCGGAPHTLRFPPSTSGTSGTKSFKSIKIRAPACPTFWRRSGTDVGRTLSKLDGFRPDGPRNEWPAATGSGHPRPKHPSRS